MELLLITCLSTAVILLGVVLRRCRRSERHNYQGVAAKGRSVDGERPPARRRFRPLSTEVMDVQSLVIPSAKGEKDYKDNNSNLCKPDPERESAFYGEIGADATPQDGGQHLDHSEDDKESRDDRSTTDSTNQNKGVHCSEAADDSVFEASGTNKAEVENSSSDSIPNPPMCISDEEISRDTSSAVEDNKETGEFPAENDGSMINEDERLEYIDANVDRSEVRAQEVTCVGYSAASDRATSGASRSASSESSESEEVGSNCSNAALNDHDISEGELQVVNSKPDNDHSTTANGGGRTDQIGVPERHREEPNDVVSSEHVIDHGQDMKGDERTTLQQQQQQQTSEVRCSASEETTWRTCLFCFKDKMASLGVKSTAFNDFVAWSSSAPDATCSGHAEALDAIRNADRDSAADSEREEWKFRAGHEGDTLSRPRRAADVMGWLREFGETLDFERRQRHRAEDWADFLTTELEAHIEARTAAEERHNVFRGRTIELVGKYKRLKAEHAALLAQLHELMRAEDAVDQRTPGRGRAALLRRKNKASLSREEMSAKRNAMMIRHSGRQRSPSDSENSEVEEEVETSGTVIRQGLSKSVDDIRQKWVSNSSKNTEGRKDELKFHESNLEVNPDRGDIHKFGNFLTVKDPHDQRIGADLKHASSTPAMSTKNVNEPHKSSLDTTEVAPWSAIRRDSQGNEIQKDNDLEEVKQQVNVKAVADMWEQKLQKIPFEVKMSTRHIDIKEANHEPAGNNHSSPKRMRIRDIEEFKRCMEETAREADCPEKSPRSNPVSLDDEDGSDVEYLSAEEDVTRSNDASTESLNTKLQTWECLTQSAHPNTNGSSESSHSTSLADVTPCGVIEQVRAKFEAVMKDDTTCTHCMSDTPVERSAEFSSLKSKWERKEQSLEDEKFRKD